MLLIGFGLFVATATKSEPAEREILGVLNELQTSLNHGDFSHAADAWIMDGELDSNREISRGHAAIEQALRKLQLKPPIVLDTTVRLKKRNLAIPNGSIISMELHGISLP